jgi:hypothetical protein
VEVGENVGKHVRRILNLEITILIIEEQENVIVVPLLEQENANGDGEPHAHIDGSNIAIELHLL